MARTKTAAAGVEAGAVEARVLVDCEFGAPNDVVSITAEEAAAGVEAGVMDTTPEAVAYAKSLVAAG